MKMPARYSDDFREVAVDVPPAVMTTVGPRLGVEYRWKCRRCGQVIKQNTAAAQSHVAKHVREALAARRMLFDSPGPYVTLRTDPGFSSFGRRYKPPVRFEYSDWYLVARYEKPSGGDGQPVEIDECRCPSPFYRIRALVSKNSVGEPKKAFTLSTGSSADVLTHRVALAISQGMLGLDT